MYKHTFVVCAYKESPFLEDCIVSLTNQTVKSKVIIVTSTPNLYIKNMAEKYNLPYLVNEGQGGITQDWNFGYWCAREKYHGDYITIAHQDDIYEKGYLAAVFQSIKGMERPLIIFGDYYEIRNGKRVRNNKLLCIKRLMLMPLRIQALWGSRWIRRRILSFGSPICCPSVTYAANNLPDVIFENRYRACEDWEAWEKLSRLKGEFVYIPKLIMGHRIHADSETTAAIGGHKRTDEELEMFCKFWPKWFARALTKQYSKGQQSNQLDETAKKRQGNEKTNYYSGI